MNVCIREALQGEEHCKKRLFHSSLSKHFTTTAITSKQNKNSILYIRLWYWGMICDLRVSANCTLARTWGVWGEVPSHLKSKSFWNWNLGIWLIPLGSNLDLAMNTKTKQNKTHAYLTPNFAFRRDFLIKFCKIH